MASLVSYLADALPSRLPGTRITVLDTYGPGAFWLMPLSFTVCALQVVVARIRGRVDLLHIHMACYGSAVRKPLLALMATSMGIRTVMHLHGADFDDYYRGLAPWRRSLLVGVLKRCARVVVIGEHWREFVAEELNLDPLRVVLIHNGAPPQVPRERHSRGTVPALLMLGELGRRKGTPELVAALALPEVRQRAWTATLAGNGAVSQFRIDVEASGLSGRINIPGWQDAETARALLGSADILLLPSHAEGLPIAILEAMAAGATIISTRVGAIPDAVVDGESGLLVPPGDVEALASAIVQLLDNPELRQRLATSAKSRFERLFRIDRTADSIAAMYRALGVARPMVDTRA